MLLMATMALAEPPSMPANLYHLVYSGRAIELFWSRSDNYGLFYEIRRNERVVKSTDDISYFDGQLISGSSYTYQVIAINPKGERSTAAVLVVNTQCGTFPTQSGVSVDLLEGPG